MFMAIGNLNLPSYLVPWQQQGMDYILSKQKLAPEYSLCTAQVLAKNKHLQDKNIHNQPLSKQPNKQSKAYQERPKQAFNAPMPNVAQSQNDMPEVPAIPFLEAKQWPLPWQELLQKTPAASVVWTYFSLGDDLSGNPNAERRNFMRKLLTDLGHPRGTHSFWPAALPDNNIDQNIASAQIFWSGVQLIKARAVVAMGQAATKAIGLEQSLRPFMHTRHNGCFVVVLRDVDFLIAEPHLYANVREFLRRSLAPFARQPY